MVGLSIASLNSNGFNNDRVKYINSIVKDNTFVFLQEHWLLPNQLNVINTRINDICSHAVSGVRNDTLLIGRPYGGCAIMWKTNFTGIVTRISFHSSRLCGLSVSMAGSVAM